MPESIELTDILLRVIGAFYAFAGFVATRAGLTSHFLDRAIAAIAAKRPTPIENAQNAWLVAASALVLAGGVSLLAGLEPAAWVFAASTLGQAAYIFVVAPRYFDRDDPPDPQGRRQTTNAFVVYAAATALVLWAAWRGRLTPLQDATTAELVAVAAALLLYAGYVARTLWWTPRAPAGGGLFGTTSDTPSRPLHESKRVKVMADYGCDPLWALDEDLYGCFAPEDLALSPELTSGLRAWAAAYDGALNGDDASTSLWGEAQHAAHAAEGRRLAGRLKRERPDLMVYVLEGDTGVVEVHPDEPT
ncbi:MAG: hypothetical protein K8F92_14845 [Hyphomicrobium sp.]|uniref:hypothetical protein n=1 Tax=Hyphomicrobium sp. TaxID=82 RepID=UPI00132120FC|nr:hypothetical protein [Hyphomicrobium sp.]KAB2937666.1 MAG: hypothetical protein F9K20_19765 [Hyphomicrobium sp.]MBZ0210910.1 hypothetical protein [Hyphomicrobium sp.]